jgi:hypothetical protein
MGASGPAPTAYTVMLTAMCLLLLAFVLLRLAYALRRRHKLLAWSTGFHALCLLWTVVRSAYWIAMLAQADMSYLALYLLYWFPTPIQCVLRIDQSVASPTSRRLMDGGRQVRQLLAAHPLLPAGHHGRRLAQALAQRLPAALLPAHGLHGHLHGRLGLQLVLRYLGR